MSTEKYAYAVHRLMDQHLISSLFIHLRASIVIIIVAFFTNVKSIS